ncbi:MAG: TolC family protein [SAR324 cluster bacterium]|nr:TolC family protein [SAR324 cluster bacterium]
MTGNHVRFLFIQVLMVIGLVFTAPVISAQDLSQWIPEGSMTPEEIQSLMSKVELFMLDNEPYAKVTLKDILQYGLERSIDLKALKLAEQIARKSLALAQNKDFPVWISSLGWNNQISSGSSSATSFMTASGSEILGFSSTWKEKLSNGIEYSMTYQESRSHARALVIAKEGDNSEPSAYSDWLDKSSFSGSVTVPLSKDSGEINQLSERIAEVSVQQSELDTEQSELSLLQEIGTTYWDMVGVVEAIEVQKAAVQLSENLLADNKARLQAGVVNETDVQISETQLVREKQALFSQQANAKRIEDVVKVALDLDQVNVGLYPKDKPQIKSYENDQQKLVQKVYEKDITLKKLNAAMLIYQYNMLDVDNQQKSDIDLVFGYAMNGYSSDPLKPVQYYGDTNLHGPSINLVWTVPFNGTLLSEKQQQIIQEREQLQLQIESQKSRLRIQLHSVLRSLALSTREIEFANTTVRLAKRQLQDEIQKMKLGKSTTFQVSQFQQQALTAIQQESAARINFEKTYLSLLVLTHDLYEVFALESPYHHQPK